MPDLTASPTGQRCSEMQLNEYDNREWLTGGTITGPLYGGKKKKKSSKIGTWKRGDNFGCEEQRGEVGQLFRL